MIVFVYFTGAGKQIASSADITQAQADELAQHFADDNCDVIEYCSSHGYTRTAEPEVLS